MSRLPFIGRQRELETLRRYTKKSPSAQLTAIYGRQRVGKTRLVIEAYADMPILHFEGLEGQNSHEQKVHFLKSLARQSGVEAHRLARPDDWTDLLILLAEHVGTKPWVVFFDEFQWMAGGRTALVSKLKYVWDNYFLTKTRVHLILCGSISSFLVKNVIQSKALYGRIDSSINLEPLTFPEVRTGALSQRSLVEALEYYLVFGGIPKYLELHSSAKSLKLNLQRNCFHPDGFFVDEYSRLFVSHFGRQRRYRDVVDLLSQRGFATRDDIVRHLSLTTGGGVTSTLADLTMAGLVEEYGSIHKNGRRGCRRYRVADPFLRFHFRFIEPLRERLHRSPSGIPLHEALPDDRYRVFRGLAFEQFCRRHASMLAKILGFSAVAYDCGSWFTRSDLSTGAQVDLLFKRADRVLTICETKFADRVDRRVIDDVERKIPHVRTAFPRYTIEPVLVTVHPPTQDVVDEAYFSRVITAEDLLS